jgi:hypothetical protein
MLNYKCLEPFWNLKDDALAFARSTMLVLTNNLIANSQQANGHGLPPRQSCYYIIYDH